MFKMDGEFSINEKKDEEGNHDEKSEIQHLKQCMLVEQQQRNLQVIQITIVLHLESFFTSFKDLIINYVGSCRN